ncbi:hypothetical protein [Kitasatospora sp. GP82]|uniref:hypothetical protein n=1 Tax=Kitasatospora sp. GP82 TaxID=3035089 RepID=UPI002473D1FC|nr:hypothetical protein [Kitasatospora sp. GP82]MDH6123195.1 hypothetical protein [Kitasatospora sp. GP82]
MAISGGDLRVWITSLTDAELRELILAPGPLPYWARVAGARRNGVRRAGQRELLTVRVWLSRAPTKDLKEIANAATRFARHRLHHCGGYPQETCANPGAEELEAMIGFLEPVLARLTLYGLLSENGPTANLVSQNWGTLLEAAARPEVPCRCRQGEVGCHSVDSMHAAADTDNHMTEISEQDEEEKLLAEDDLPVPDWTELADLARSLRERSSSVAERLGQAADRVRAGLGLPEGVLDEAAAWSTERAALADRTAVVGLGWNADEGFAGLHASVEGLRAEAEERAARAARLTLLETQRETLLKIVEQAGQDSGGVYLETLRASLHALDDEIASLGGDAGPTEALPAVPAEEPAAENGPTTADSEPVDERVDEKPGEEVEEPTRSASETAPEPPTPQPEAEQPFPPEAVAETPATPELPTAAPEPLADVPGLENSTAEPADEPGTEETAYLAWQSTQDDENVAAEASPVERLVTARRFQEAYWLTLGSAEPAHRAESLAFTDAAFSCDLAEEATPVMTRFVPDLEALQGDRPALILATVASLRAGLVAGWPNDLLLQTDPSALVPGPWGRLLECAVDVLRRYQRFDPATLHPRRDAEPILTRTGIAAAAAELATSLPLKKIGYARATQVQNRLIGAEQPLGRALAAVRAWAAEEADTSVLEEAWETFRKRDASERIIEDADAAIRTPKQAKEPIEAKAKRSLLNRIEQVVTLLSQARALAAPGAEELGDTVTALRHAVDQVRQAPALPGPEGAALLRLRAWFLGEDSAPVPLRVLDVAEGEARLDTALDIAPGTEALLAALDLPRSRDGLPLPSEPGFAEAVALLLAPVNIRSVVTAYAERGDLHLADSLVEALEQGLVPAAPAGIRALPPDWRTLRDAEWARWSGLRREAHRMAAGRLAELRTQNLDDLTERELVGRLEHLEQPTPDGAFRAAVEDIRRLEQELDERLQAYLARLYEQLDSLVISEQDHKRLTELLRAGDTVTAEECLALLREGSALPDWSSVDWGDELRQFMAGLETVRSSKAGAQGYSARPWAELYADGQPLTEGSRIGLESWDALCKPTTRGSEWQKHVPSVLRVLGLEGRTPTRDDHQQVRGILRLTAKLAANEAAPGYVAALGSAAITYTVLVVADELRGRSPLELLRNETGACIILYLYPLGLAGRRVMATHARTSSQQALVVDPAVFGWTAARSPRSFRAAQRVTLPWTAFTPYTPFVAGLVPPEVFYGRSKEMATVVDPLGALFLYGGRQLGKSALLRKVEATFPMTPERKAIYLDLKARGVGEAEPADRIWSVLSAELKRVGVLGPKVSSEVSADVLLDHVRRWLEENRERRVLVLADEADAFLTADSKAVHGRGGEGTFANVARLKGLMDSTDRRFKIVFAGLHQVQRFSHLSNVPLAHGGPDVLIGPLKPAEAQRLVVEPMAAFGYRFERPDLVWRVLAATNYQACLVQIFCDRLVAALREKPLGSAQWPITVTEEDIRAVTGSAQVHRNIAERLRITINLEDRYRVLALVIALRSGDDRFQRGYDADYLLSEAKRHWPDGFNKLTASDVKIYLDEMVGLGLLVQEADRRNYAVRSPNVVRMLGTREDLELELRQTEFSLPYDYNPRFSRRLVGSDPHGVARYSPLTEQQLYEATSPGATVVCLTKAHGPELVTLAISSYADARGLTVHTAGPDDLAGVLTRDARSRQPSVVLADVRTCGLEVLRQAVEKLHAHMSHGSGAPHRAAVLVVDPMTWLGFGDERVTSVLRPERWNADSLRAWPECPFDTPDKRRRLADATGGWPSVVERTVHQATRGGATLEAALDQVTAYFAQPGNAADHLARVELDQDVIEPLSVWAEYVEAGEGCGHADIAAVTGLELDEVRRLTSRLTNHGVLDDSEDGYALDLITFQALGVVRRGV